MAEFVFTSPGVKFRERDLSFVQQNIAITFLGVVGETMKGPAFEPVFVQDKTQYLNRFGGQSVERFSNGSLRYQLPYVANTYLDQSNQLWVTRVLGLSGYDAGKAWAITLEAGVDPNTIASGSSAITTASFTDNIFMGVSINAIDDTGIVFDGFVKVSDSGFTGTSYYFICTAYSTSTGSGTVSITGTTFTAGEYTDYKNMVLAVVRSRGYVIDNVNLPPTTRFLTTTVSLPASGNTTILGTGDLFGQFNLIATSGSTSESYITTLNPDASSFLPYVIGSKPKDKTNKIWVEAVYPDLIKKLDSDGLDYPAPLAPFGLSGTSPYAYGVSSRVIECTNVSFTDYKTQFQTPETPWVVSEIKGNSVSRLFKFVSISDGDAANQEIKISIANINPISLEFDVIVRDFNDNDSNVNVLESFTRCTLTKGQNSYIGQRIGTTDGEYDILSKYIMVEVASDIAVSDFPAGFEGYLFNNYVASATTSGSPIGVIPALPPKIFYKTKYNDDERVKKVYLGISEKAYSTTSVVGTGINQNFFNFNGQVTSENHVKTNGFHMDIDATGVTSNGFSFDTGVGYFQTIEDVTVDPTATYYDINTRKFTLVPAGGFDGWDVNRVGRSYGDFFRLNSIFDGVDPNGIATNDYQAWETAINTFANPENITINLFATPGINWSDQNALVLDTIEMIETQRTDTLYVIDSPDNNITTTIGDGGRADVLVSQDIVDHLITADIDSSYCCTYFPWIQISDSQNNTNVFIPPTGEVVKAMAFTDNTAFPWFAPAGLNRGVTSARKSKYKLSLEARDVLYAGRINPLADFADTGTAIFGQKTLQVADTALNRINVRRLLLQIKVLIANIAIRLVFEQNDQTTMDQFLSKATPILDTIKRERGLYDFRIKMDSSNNTPETIDRNELYGEIFLKPTRAVEFIGITFTITPSGASFDDIGA
jgi:hypothetical protein